ncbi:unnamed protein product, partial [Didymodactylos carnosus]
IRLATNISCGHVVGCMEIEGV